MTCRAIVQGDREVGFICAPEATIEFRRIRECPTCKRRRRFVVAAYEWYGAMWTCCGCGDAWSDGERLPRPFARGWRARSIAKAKAKWEELGAA